MVRIDHQLPVAATDRAHVAVSGICPPVQRAFDSGSSSFQNRKKVYSVVVRWHRRSRRGNNRSAKVHGNSHLIGDTSWLDMAGPLNQGRHTDSSLPHGPLAIEQWPPV